jgi:hypothetical protein
MPLSRDHEHFEALELQALSLPLGGTRSSYNIIDLRGGLADMCIWCTSFRSTALSGGAGKRRLRLAGGLIERRAPRGLCIWRFCERAGVSTAALHAWKRKPASGPQYGWSDGARCASWSHPTTVPAIAAGKHSAAENPGG